ncbi:hypothetical protein PR048_005998 [Dryococelus australis]|uniref:Endonuclease/exonuclease/phosphatase domain-containing protein n=1 Tax=Dryococelus australis TaxID=614101 RepID=A0ABQ9IAB8_9NEOP|nr:hypothetical protein PR048_005998 [Dryococelus australis]
MTTAPHLQSHILECKWNVETTKKLNMSTEGGTAIIIKRTIHHRITLSPLNHIKATAISVLTGGTHIIFTAAYKPPQNPITNENLDQLIDHQSHFLIAGDLNSKHTD